MYNLVLEAAERLKGVAHKTPVLTSRQLIEITNNRVFLKCENFQRVGAFKFRGAYNAITKLIKNKNQNIKVLTYSSGNHAQAVALAANMFNLECTIIMPNNAPRVKIDATQSYGAKIIQFDPEEITREEVADKLLHRSNYIFIPPFNHLDIIAGQGTSAKEFLEEVHHLDYLLAPCGGGGLLSGTAISSKYIQSNCKVVGIEPEVANDAVKSFYSGKIHSVFNPKTIADGVRTHSLGELNFKIIKELVDDMFTVTEDEIIKTMHFLWTRLKIIVEPTGAVALAYLFSDKCHIRNKNIGIIISGGNVDIATACQLFSKIE